MKLFGIAFDSGDLGPLLSLVRKTNLACLLARRPHRIFPSDLEQGEIGLELFRTPAAWALKAWFRIAATTPIGSAGQIFG